MNKEKTDMFTRRWPVHEMSAYFGQVTSGDEGFAAEITAAMERDGIRGESVSALEGRLLESMARLCGARKAVEIGSLYGYSARWLARGLADGGRLYSLENAPACVNAAKDFTEAAGLSREITVMEGPALDSLKTLSKLAPFDLCFIDADAENYPAYLRWAAANLRPGGLVLADRTFLRGKLSDDNSSAGENTRARAMREFFHVLFDADRFLSASVLPTGEGMAMGIK
jgi:predicted O-methyltransferase YrrM